jgi:apolipoprotein N-acyltransferase
MWKPFTKAGVPLNLAGPGTIMIAGERAAPIICYEQLIAWPVLTSFLQQPTIIVAVSNNIWVGGTAIPKIEQTSIRSWAALFNLPAIFASNS